MTEEYASLEDQLNGIKAFLCYKLNETIGPKDNLGYVWSYNDLARAIRQVVSGEDFTMFGLIAKEARRRIDSGEGKFSDADRYYFGTELKPE